MKRRSGALALVVAALVAGCGGSGDDAGGQWSSTSEDEKRKALTYAR